MNATLIIPPMFFAVFSNRVKAPPLLDPADQAFDDVAVEVGFAIERSGSSIANFVFF